MHYETFELRIQPGQDGRYEALVTRSLAGDARASFTLPWADGVQAATLWQAVGASRTAAVRHHLGAAGQDGEPAANLQALGTQLYQALFSGAVGACLRRSLDEAKRRGVGLRIRLRVDDRLPALANLPWEYLYAPELGRFLALSDDTPLLRYLEVPHAVAMQPAPPPLTVLAVLSNPAGVTPLAVEEEWRHLQEAVADLGEEVRLERVEATWSALQARLRQIPAHVIHFIGHGYFDDRAQDGEGEGGLIFEDEHKQPVRVSAQRFKVLLGDKESLRLVFLNACEGARGGRSSSFAGVAQQLVQQAVPAVLAMQFPVSDRAAIVLSREFYRALADGYPVEAATSEARKAIYGQDGSLEWGTPVLFSRAEDNRLIELLQGDRRPAIERKMPFEPESIPIPAGSFPMGSNDPDLPAAEQPQHTVPLPNFRMGKRPVTVRQYAAFIKDRKAHPAPPGWFNREPPAGRLDAPVTEVSWFDALAYCAWLSEETGRAYTLPSEAEWERAWGQGGVEEMLGAVQQWTRSLWGSQPQQPDYAYPYDPGDGREVTDPATLPPQARLVHRGGSFKSKSEELRAAARGNALPNSQIAWRGFRVAMQIP